MQRHIVFGLICFSLAGCNQALVMQDSKIAQNAGVRCRLVTPTGSHRPIRVCTSAAQRTEESARAAADLEHAQEQQRREPRGP